MNTLENHNSIYVDCKFEGPSSLDAQHVYRKYAKFSNIIIRKVYECYVWGYIARGKLSAYRKPWPCMGHILLILHSQLSTKELGS